MSLQHIPVVATNPDVALSGNAPALLREIAERLSELLHSGTAAAIDLKGLPLTQSDLDWLRSRLGRGEVVATLHASGESEIVETAFPGVWWITHRNESGAVVAILIEINLVPEIVQTHPDAARAGLQSLQALIAEGRL
jgi:hydrogenase-1 operon protein HyaF